jgi:hypothetical protein
VSAHLLLVSFCVFSKMLVEVGPALPSPPVLCQRCVHGLRAVLVWEFQGHTALGIREGIASCDLSLCQERRGVLYRDNHSPAGGPRKCSRPVVYPLSVSPNHPSSFPLRAGAFP